MDKCCVCIKKETVEDRRSGKIIIIIGINDNILISSLYYLGVYQDEAKNESYTKILLFLVWDQTKKLTKLRCTLLVQ